MSTAKRINHSDDLARKVNCPPCPRCGGAARAYPPSNFWYGFAACTNDKLGQWPLCGLVFPAPGSYDAKATGKEE